MSCGLFLYKYEKKLQTQLKNIHLVLGWFFINLTDNKYKKKYKNYSVDVNSPVSVLRLPFPYFAVNSSAIFVSSF